MRVELRLPDDDRPLEVIVSQDIFRELALKAGESVFVRPKEMKVFRDDVADYAI